MTLSRDWMFTWNNPDPEFSCDEGYDPLLVIRDIRPVKYVVYQLERGASGTLHMQGMIRFENAVRVTAAKKWWKEFYTASLGPREHPLLHWEARKGSPEQAIAYCTKAETRVAGPWEFGKSGVGRGKRTDLEEAYALGISGKGIRGALRETSAPGRLLKNERIFQRASMIFPTPRNLQFVEVYWGDSGTGKTHDALAKFKIGLEGEIDPPYVVPASSQWFPGYSGEKHVIFDEFYGGIKYAQMLQLLDRNCFFPKVEDKGTHYPFMAEHIIITSNCHPKEWYDCDKGYKVPLLRRINRIVHYTRNPDGQVCKKEEANHAQEVPFHAETW